MRIVRTHKNMIINIITNYKVICNKKLKKKAAKLPNGKIFLVGRRHKEIKTQGQIRMRKLRKKSIFVFRFFKKQSKAAM